MVRWAWRTTSHDVTRRRTTFDIKLLTGARGLFPGSTGTGCEEPPADVTLPCTAVTAGAGGVQSAAICAVLAFGGPPRQTAHLQSGRPGGGTRPGQSQVPPSFMI